MAWLCNFYEDVTEFSDEKSTALSAGTGVAGPGLAWLVLPPAHAQWVPSKPVELVVPAGTGGGADQMARFLQG